MRFNKLDLNLLVALDAMLSLRSISRAADKLSLSQSAMSSALGRLRDYFGDDLLVQVGRRMDLTPRAETLQQAVRDVLLRVDTTIAAQPSFDPATSSREFRISLSDFTLVTLIPHLMALVHEQSSTLSFQLLSQVSEPQRALERGEVDVLLMPQELCSPEHPLDVLWQEDFCSVLWRDSAIARSEFTYAAYAAAGHVVMQPPASARSIEVSRVDAAGLLRRVDITTFSFLSAPYLVVGTECVATVFSRLALLMQSSLPIVIRQVPMPIAPMHPAAQWHKYRTQDPGIVWLRGMLRAAVVRMDAALGTFQASAGCG